MKTKLDEALEFIELRKEAENYKIYYFLRRLIAQNYGISIQRLESSQEYKSVEARMILSFLLKNYTDYKYRNIGILLGAKHHSQIHSSVKTLSGYFKRNLYRSTILSNCLEAEKCLKDFLKSECIKSPSTNH
ncbi:MAG: hypothetical protein NVV82_00250 [Sporocytophaga sp.]|nr:hypothetical protein [Sporocytophaga sp.]